MPNTFRDIICYPNLLPFQTTPANIETFMAGLSENGATHVQVNHLPDLMHPEQLSQPDNIYLAFANFGPPLDLYVDSDLNRGIWPEMYLERNRKVLLDFAEAARRHGIKPVMYLCEPRFVPERLFDRHPTLRGPRVDNPTISCRPLYALCTDFPEVKAHYRDMMAEIMKLIPDLSMITIFTSDSGAGFDYSHDLYAGPNGAAFNKKIPVKERVVNFLRLLHEEGRKKVPDFSVNLTSGFSPEERAEILRDAPKDVVGSVYGLYDWEGGLEEMWAYHQTLWGEDGAPHRIQTLDRERAWEERLEDYRGRFEVAAEGGREPVAHAEVPTTDYPRPLRYVPQPLDTAKVLKALHAVGARRLAVWGVLNARQLVPFDVNREMMNALQADIGAEPGECLRAIAAGWVGPDFVDPLVDAWRECDRAWTRRPNWLHVGLSRDMLLGPLVPDLTVLNPKDLAYYRTAAGDQHEAIKGFGFFVPREADEEKRGYVLREMYEKETLPTLERAAGSLKTAAEAADGASADCLRSQSESIELGWLYQRMLRNWYEAGCYLAPGDTPNPLRGMKDIVEDDIEATESMINLLDGRVEQFLRVYPLESMGHEFGRNIVDHLRRRVLLMKKHRDDTPRPVNEGRL